MSGYTITPNLGLKKPLVGADDDAWGGHLNENADVLDTAFVATAAAGASANVGRNLLHNSMFNVAQRGAGPWTTAGYSLDRWRIASVSSGGSFTVSRAEHNDASRAEIGDEAAAYTFNYAYNTTGAAAGDFDVIQQHIEDVRRLAGKTVIVSFYAACASGAMKVGVSIDQIFGTGGSPSASVEGNGQAITLGTAWARFSVALAVPSIAGKTLGTTSNNATVLNIWFNSGATNALRAGSIGQQGNNTVAIWGVQLEVGTVATPLEKPDYGLQLSQCQRFYQTGTVALSGMGSAGGGMAYILALPVRLRANATAVTTTPTQQINCSGLTVGAAALDQAGYVFATATATAASAFAYAGTFTISADL